MVKNWIRLICLMLVLTLVWPTGAAYAQEPIQGEAYVQMDETDSDIWCGEQISRNAVASAADIPLSEGYHEKWIDRIGNLPDYARDLYVWLEENANAQGALADPTKADLVSGRYAHMVTVVTGTTEAVCDQSEYQAVAKKIASEAMAAATVEAKAYVGAVYDAFDRDHPEVFWLSGSSQYGHGGSYSLRYSMNKVKVTYEAQVYFYLKTSNFDIRYEAYRNPSDIAKGITQRDNLVKEILAKCPKTGTREQIRYLNKVLTERNAYNSAVAMGWVSSADRKAWECLNALAGSTGAGGPVCEGYSKAFMLLCHKLGIPCILVDGLATNAWNVQPQSHMWNYVCVDGGWYGMDITWNDPYYTKNPTSAVSGFEGDDWMFLGAETMVDSKLNFISSHIVENQVGSNRLQFLNGPLLYDQAMRIDGTVTSFGDTNAQLTLTLQTPGESSPVCVKTYQGKKVSFVLDFVAPGSYTLVVSKPEHVTREYKLNANEAADLQLKICLLGDINGDGRINVGDVAKIYAHARKTALLTDEYQLLCADMTGDTRVNIGDAARAYAKVKA